MVSELSLPLWQNCCCEHIPGEKHEEKCESWVREFTVCQGKPDCSGSRVISVDAKIGLFTAYNRPYITVHMFYVDIPVTIDCSVILTIQSYQTKGTQLNEILTWVYSSWNISRLPRTYNNHYNNNNNNIIYNNNESCVPYYGKCHTVVTQRQWSFSLLALPGYQPQLTQMKTIEQRPCKQ